MAAGGRKKGLIIILIAILIFLIVVAAGAFWFLSGNLFNMNTSSEISSTPTPGQNLTQIIIVAQNVKRGTIITDAMLGTVAYPQSEMVANLFFTDMQNVLGKTAKFDLAQGSPLTSALLSENAVGSLLASQIPEGQVAISIPIDALTSVSYALQPGDHVSIIVTISIVDLDASFQTILPNFSVQVLSPAGQELVAKVSPGSEKQGRAELDLTLNQAIYAIPSEEQRPRMVSQSLVQDSVVVWVGNFPYDENPADVLNSSSASQPTPENAPAPEAGAAPTPVPPPDKIALAVSPQDAVTINYVLQSNGKLTLALRSASETPNLSTDAVTLQYLLDKYSIPYPAKLPYGVQFGQSDPPPAAAAAPQ